MREVQELPKHFQKEARGYDCVKAHNKLPQKSKTRPQVTSKGFYA